METRSLEAHPFILPGEYDAWWCAYYVTIKFHNGNKSHDIKMNNGIRGMGKCKVNVNDKGWVTVID